MENQTSVLILQHRRERFHPFNTARIVHQALERCQWMVANNAELAEQFESTQLSEHVGLLYPGKDAIELSEVPPDQRPKQLVVIDGTWHQAKTVYRDVLRLKTLPRYKLRPSQPGRYRIRREPNVFALSTLEATVAALMAIEPDTKGLKQLLEVFERMIDDQLQHTSSNWRSNHKRRRGSPNLPRILTGSLDNIVVAYGEQEQGNRAHHRTDRSAKPKPIYWTATRLVSGEAFQCAIESESWQDAEFLNHLQLDASVGNHAIGLHEFREQWRSFLRPTDHVAVHHRSTARLLENAEADFSPTVILKSIHLPGDVTGEDCYPRRSREQRSPCSNESRAQWRLANAVQFVRELNSRYAANGTALGS